MKKPLFLVVLSIILILSVSCSSNNNENDNNENDLGSSSQIENEDKSESKDPVVLKMIADIDSIGSVELEDEDLIQRLVDRYKALPDSQKEQISNLVVLLNAEEELEVLKKQSAQILAKTGYYKLDRMNNLDSESQNAFDLYMARGLEGFLWLDTEGQGFFYFGTKTEYNGVSIEWSEDNIINLSTKAIWSYEYQDEVIVLDLGKDFPFSATNGHPQMVFVKTTNEDDIRGYVYLKNTLIEKANQREDYDSYDILVGGARLLLLDNEIKKTLGNGHYYRFIMANDGVSIYYDGEKQKSDSLVVKKLSACLNPDFAFKYKKRSSSEETYILEIDSDGLILGVSAPEIPDGYPQYDIDYTTLNHDTKTTITMWCTATEYDALRGVYEKAFNEMKERYPNISVKWEAFDYISYKSKLKAAIASNELPDIFYTWTGAVLNGYTDKNLFYSLNSVLNKYISNGEIAEAMLNNTTYDKKHYGIPLTMSMTSMFVNMDVLKKVGYTSVPMTYDELLQCCDKLLAAGYYPFGCSEETWCVTEYLELIFEKCIGAEALNDIFLGRGSFNNQGITDAIGIFEDMIKKSYFDPDASSLNNDQVIRNFTKDKYAFYVNGTWNASTFDEYGDKIQIAEFPVINESSVPRGQFEGGPNAALIVSASAKNPRIVAEYAVELGKLICKYEYLMCAGLPTWKVDYDDRQVNRLTKEAAKLGQAANSFANYGDNVLSESEVELYFRYVDLFYNGYIDSETFAGCLAKGIR